MKVSLRFIFSIIIVVGLLARPGFSENKKLAQTGMKFLSVSMDARASALSSAMTSMEGTSICLMYNPSGMARLKSNFHFSIGRVGWIADINYLYGTAAYRPAKGQYGVFGISFLSVDYGDFQGTILANNDQGFLDVGMFNPTAYSIGIGYAKTLTNKFSIGAQIKYIKQNLVGGIVDFYSDESQNTEAFSADVFAFDIGLQYAIGIKSLRFGMSIRNFSEEIEYIKESFQLPLLFEMGLSFNFVDLMNVDPEKHTLWLSIDALHPRDYPEQVDIGVEYVFMKMFALRMGYTYPTDEQGMSFGLGLEKNLKSFGLGLDYSYTPFGVFKDIHRFSFQFSF